jgi:hypothetical protein
MIRARARAQTIVSNVSLHHGFTTSVAKRKSLHSYCAGLIVPEPDETNDNANTGNKQPREAPAFYMNLNERLKAGIVEKRAEKQSEAGLGAPVPARL